MIYEYLGEIVDIFAMTSPSRTFRLDILRLVSRDCSGATKVEYSLIAALVSVAVLSGASDLGMLVYSIVSKTSQTIEQAANGGTDGSGNGMGQPSDNGPGNGSGNGGDGSGGNCGPGNGNGNCANSGNGGGNTGGSGTGTGNGGGNNGQGQNSGNGNGGSNKK